MRRGLMGWNAEELPKAALEARIARLRAAMQRNGFDAALFYTNLVQPSAVTWLTGFTPYWSDGMLLLPAQGAPVFATALSKRVANWIRTTNTLSEIVNTPKPGAAVGKRIAEAGCKRVGVLEYDALPAGLYDEIAGAAPGVELADLGGVFAEARRSIDDAERGLIGRADALARTALDLIDADKADRRRRGRGTGREARAARRRRGSLYRGRARSRCRPAPDPRRRDAAARRALRGAGVGGLQGLLGAADPKLRPRRGRAARLCRRRCLAGARRVVDRARQAAGRAARRASEGAARRDAAQLDGGKLHRQLSAGQRVAATRRPAGQFPRAHG